VAAERPGHDVGQPARPDDLERAGRGRPCVQARDAELRVVAAGTAVGARAVRELLALQSSDWAFLAARGTAGDYPRRRAAAHRRALDEALALPEAFEPALRTSRPSGSNPLLSP
jgi:1,4-alpha-glucan branching enzyme